MGSQSKLLHESWQIYMLTVTAEQLIFIDESMFKLQTGWHLWAYSPISQPAQFHDNHQRGKTWSILPAYTTEDYLSYISIKEDYYNTNEFYNWIINKLLPNLQPYSGPWSIVCLNNVNVHLHNQIQHAIKDHSCHIKFLPPYSLDYSPIELTFSVLKSWLQQHLRRIQGAFEDRFGCLMEYTIKHSECNRFIIKHFKHSAGEYWFEGWLWDITTWIIKPWGEWVKWRSKTKIEPE